MHTPSINSTSQTLEFVVTTNEQTTFTMPDVARVIGCSPDTVRRYCERRYGRLRVGQHRELTRAEFQAVVADLCQIEVKSEEGHEGQRRKRKCVSRWASRVLDGDGLRSHR